jgi:hypothetical protein
MWLANVHFVRSQVTAAKLMRAIVELGEHLSKFESVDWGCALLVIIEKD